MPCPEPHDQTQPPVSLPAGPDFIDVEFPKNSEGIKRHVQFLTTPKRLLPVNVEFGYAMSIHKFQGSQASVVIAIAEPGTKAGGIVQASSIYTCCSRARDHLIVLGNLDDFNKASRTLEIRRDTLLLQLLTKRDPQYSEERTKKRPRPVIEPGARVASETFGDGVILSVETGKFGKLAQVKFDDGSLKKIFVSALRASACSEPAAPEGEKAGG